MNYYKLINKTTGKETYAEKVNLNGFDYYVNNTEPESYVYIKHKNKILKADGIGELSGEVFHEKGFNLKEECQAVIATNNPGTEIDKIIEITQTHPYTKKDIEIIYYQ